MRGDFRLDTSLWLPLPRAQVFDFFADAFNLERITPAFLRFTVTTAPPIAMVAGALIDYRIGLHGLPIAWKTKITLWEPPVRFVDTQLRGPYRQWVHTHTFDEVDNGTLVKDAVRYRAPGPGWFAALASRLLIARDVTRIFEYRHDALQQALGVSGRSGPVTVSAVA
ncbi:MAG: SRPBCC family protein [Betaproteobacteria bacterium]